MYIASCLFIGCLLSSVAVQAVAHMRTETGFKHNAQSATDRLLRLLTSKDITAAPAATPRAALRQSKMLSCKLRDLRKQSREERAGRENANIGSNLERDVVGM